MKRISFVIVLLLLVSQTVHADFGGNLSFWMISDQNAYQNYEMVSDVIMRPEASLHYLRSTAKRFFRVEMGSSLYTFDSYADRQYFSHQLGITGRTNTGVQNLDLAASIQWSRRINEPLYQYYNYQYAKASVALIESWKPWHITRIGFDINRKTYDDLGQFDFDETRASFQERFTFPSKTTVIATIQIGAKQFLESQISASDVEAVVAEAVIQRNPDNPRGNSGNGTGNGNSGGQGNNGGGNGNGQGNQNTEIAGSDPQISMFQSTTPSIAADEVLVDLVGNKARRIDAGLRIAQSISQKLGIVLEGNFARRLDGEGRYLSYQDGGYEMEDVLFDDPYNFEHESFSLEGNLRIFKKLVWRSGIEIKQKHYFYPAYDLTGLTILDNNRDDRRETFWFDTEYQLRFQGLLKSMALKLSLQHIYNQSNDPFFDYSHWIFLGGYEMAF